MKRTTDFAACVSEYFTKYLAGVRNLSPNTIKSYRDTFCLLLAFMEEEMHIKIEKTTLSDIDDKLICSFLDWLESKRRNSAATRNLRLAAIHAFYRYVQMQHPEMLLQCQRIMAIPVKETEKRIVDYLPEDVLKELLSLPNQTQKYGMRDTALLCLLYDSGARVQEIIDLSLADVRLDTLPTVRLLGKGRKVRIVPLMSQTGAILQKYMNIWKLNPTKKPDDPLFMNHQGGRLTRPGVTYILKKYVEQTTWQTGKKAVTPHVIRHSKAMHLLRANVDLHYIRDFLGHVQIETTEVYARADAEMKRKALEKVQLDIPVDPQTSWQKDQSLLTWLQSL
jgi:site-specific recombinase XerD